MQPPGPGSPTGLIASGTINGKYWQLATGKPGTGGTTSGNQEIYLSGAALENAMTGIVPDLSTDHPAPVAFADVGIPPVEAQYGPVQADVSYVKVALDNGTVLTLHPVTAYGARVVAFATPLNARIVSATAYSRHGEIATAIPFNEGDGQAFFGIWLKPGQHGIGRASGSIGSGTVGGNTWSASAYLGPWGVCIVSVTGSICAPAAASTLGTAVMASTESGTPRVITGVASPSVVRIVAAPARRHRDPGPAGDDRRPEVLRVLGKPAVLSGSTGRLTTARGTWSDRRRAGSRPLQAELAALATVSGRAGSS